MRKLISIIALCFSFTSISALAHDGVVHDAVDSKTASKNAKHVISEIIKMKKLNGSWAGIDAVSAEKKMGKKNEEWVVTFNNENIENNDEQTIYIFLTLDGHYIAANYTGS